MTILNSEYIQTRIHVEVFVKQIVATTIDVKYVGYVNLLEFS